jgi:Yip1 domain
MNCPNCHQLIASDARFCATCGTRSPSAADPQISMGTAGATLTAGSSTDWSTHAPAGGTAGFVQRLKNILLTPKTEWPVIESEQTSPGQLLVGYAMPFTALMAVLSFIRMSVIGIRVPFGDVIRTPVTAGITYAVVTFVMGLIGVYLLALIVNAWAPTFGAPRDQRQALKVAVYSLTPAWLASVLALSPILATLLQLLAGLYGIYVLYLGLPIVMRSARERAVGYTVAVVLSTILLGVIFGVASATLGIFGRSAHVFGGSALERQARQEAAREQGSAIVGNVIGNALGTDAKGKADLQAALSNVAKAGEHNDPGSATQSTSSTGGAQANSGNDSAQATAAAAGGLLSALGSAMRGDHNTKTVDFAVLKDLLPASLPGMTRTSAVGENKQAMGVTAASAKADYQGNGGSVHVEIADLSGVSGLMDLANGLASTTASEGNGAYEKQVIVAGRSAHEKYDSNAHSGELTVMLAKRYQVAVSGEHVDMGTLERALGQVDLNRLESMKSAGGQ